MTRSVKRKLFEQEGQTFRPMTIVEKTYWRKRKMDVTKREVLEKTVETPLLSSQEEHQDSMDRKASKQPTWSDKGS